MSFLRLAAFVTAWVALSHTDVRAAVTRDPNLVDVGGVLLGDTGSGTVTLDGDGERVDLVITNCSGGGGLFSFSDTNDIQLNTARVITVYYVPNARGIQTCTVNIVRSGNDEIYNSFTIRGNGQLPPTAQAPNNVAFGNVRFRDGTPLSSSVRSVRVTNAGDRALNITSVTSSSGDYTFTGGTSATINPGAFRDWTVTFNPGGTTAEARNASLSFASNNDPGGTRTVMLNGGATTATIAVTPPAIDYGIVSVGSSKVLDVTVKNSVLATEPYKGSLGVTVGTITVTSGPTTNYFSFTACDSATCAFAPPLAIVNTDRVLGIRCSPPSGTAVQTATVTFASDSDSAGGNTLTLSCQAGASDLAMSTPTLVFDPLLISSGSQTKTITVLNRGTEDAMVELVPYGTHAAQFAATGPGCGTSAARCPVTKQVGAVPGSIVITVTVSPTTEGPISAGIDVVPVTGGKPSFSVSGRGIFRHLDVAGLEIGTYEFPDTYRNPFDAPTTKQVPIFNSGEYPLQVNALTIGGDTDAWSLAQPFAPFLVDPQATVNVDVNFTPYFAGKAPSGTLTIETDAKEKLPATLTQDGVALIQLAGNGKDRNVDMVPGSINVGDTIAGVPTRLSIARPGDVITVVNMDAQPFRIRNIMIDDGGVAGGDAARFRLEGMDGNPFSPTDIAPGEMKQYDVVFTPPYPGTFESSVLIYLDQDPSPQKSVPISGNAQYVDAHGGGGCASGPSGGDGRTFTLVLLGLVLVLRRRRR